MWPIRLAGTKLGMQVIVELKKGPEPTTLYSDYIVRTESPTYREGLKTRSSSRIRHSPDLQSPAEF